MADSLENNITGGRGNGINRFGVVPPRRSIEIPFDSRSRANGSGAVEPDKSSRTR